MNENINNHDHSEVLKNHDSLTPVLSGLVPYTEKIKQVSSYVNKEFFNSSLEEIRRKDYERNPLRTNETEGIKGIRIPNIILDIDSSTLRSKKTDLIYCNLFNNSNVSIHESLKKINLFSSYINKNILNNQENSFNYLNRLELIFLENKDELSVFIKSLIDWRKDHKTETSHKTAFVVHIGNTEQATNVYPQLSVLDKNDIYEYASKLPTFVISQQNIIWPDNTHTRCSVVCAPLLPSFALNRNSRRDAQLKARSAAHEAIAYAALIENAETIGLGGMLAASSERGVSGQISLDLIKFSLLKYIEETKNEDIFDMFPNIFSSRVTTGHVGTTLSIIKTLEQDAIKRNLDNKNDTMIIGAGNIGRSVAYDLLNKGKERNPFAKRIVVMIDENNSISSSLCKQLNQEATESNVNMEFISISSKNISQSEFVKNISQIVICTSATNPADQQPEFKSYFESLKDVTIVNDNHPPAISDPEKFIRAGNQYTDVGYPLPQNSQLLTIFGNEYKLGKPNDGTILYGCQFEALIAQRLNTEGNIGNTTYQKIQDFDAEVTNFFGGNVPKIKFHYNQNILD